MFSDPLTLPYTAFALGCAVVAAGLLLWYLAARPALGRATKIVLLLGIGVLPLGTAANGNVAGFHATKTRTFCGSCHVMTPFSDDVANPGSTSLAARHGRNEEFGGEACYTCHADYGMFETVVTKFGGMRHVYEYALNFHQLSLEEALPKIHIRRPFPNTTCMRCHSTEAPIWRRIGDHRSLLDEVRRGEVSCASNGCHGPAHPFAQVAHIKAEQAVHGAQGSAERGSSEPGSAGQGSVERGSVKRGSSEPGSAGQGSVERGSVERGSSEPGSAGQGSVERGSAERSRVEPDRGRRGAP